MLLIFVITRQKREEFGYIPLIVLDIIRKKILRQGVFLLALTDILCGMAAMQVSEALAYCTTVTYWDVLQFAQKSLLREIFARENCVRYGKMKMLSYGGGR